MIYSFSIFGNADLVHSRVGLIVFQLVVVLTSFSIAIGYGAYLDIPFCAEICIILCLILGMASDDGFLLGYQHTLLLHNENLSSQDRIALCMSKSGLSVFITSITDIFALMVAYFFFQAQLIRDFCISIFSPSTNNP